MRTVAVFRVLVLALAAVALVGCLAPRTQRPPSFLVIVADDLGQLDLGLLGSEIRTPNLDRLAREGLLLTRLLVSPTCSPTRAMLLTGRGAHAAGLGTMAGCALDGQVGAPGYEGHLRADVPTLAELLQRAGYRTAMAGKWHLGGGDAQPHRRGFARSFALLPGGASHFADAAPLLPPDEPARYVLDGAPVALPDGFYSSEAYTDRLIEFVDEALAANRPFFAYAAYTAPHWPLQVPDDWLERCTGRYDDGWDALRARRFAAARAHGLIPADASAPPRTPFAPAWDALAAEQRAHAVRTMQIYAAMVENLDHHIGRLLEALRARGALDDTVVVFFSDNGPEGNPIERLGDAGAWIAQRFDNSLANIGRRGSYVWPGPGWAQASAAPFRLFKAFPTEGGVRTTAIVRGPFARRGRSDALVRVEDIAPTLLGFAGARAPSAMTGRSLRAFLAGERDAVYAADDVLAAELFGRRSVQRGRYKALWLWPPYGVGAWELYDLERDPGEQRDLARAQPEVLEDLAAAWQAWAAANGVVLPARDGGYALEAGR